MEKLINILFLIITVFSTHVNSNELDLKSYLDNLVGVTPILNCNIEVLKTTIGESADYDEPGFGIAVYDLRTEQLSTIYINEKALKYENKFIREFKYNNQQFTQYLKVILSPWGSPIHFEVAEFNSTKWYFTQRALCKLEHLGPYRR